MLKVKQTENQMVWARKQEHDSQNMVRLSIQVEMNLNTN